MPRLTPRVKSALLLLSFVLLTLPATAQVTGSVSGTVRDADGAPLPGSTITAQGEALQQASLVAIGDEEGHYRLAPLPPGTYQVSAELPGFQKQIVEGVRVGINAAVRLDLTLDVLSVDETLIVTAETAVLELDRSELASRISPQTIDNLPLDGRNFEDLVSLVPGVKPNPQGVRDQQFSIFGERAAATGFVVDGGDNYDPLDGGPFQRFAQDSIQEFEVITQGYEAEFGRSQGGIVNVLTRSGTEETRASAFYFLRNDSLDSSNVGGQSVPDLERDQWGGSLGGALLRERAFYFLSGEQVEEARGRNIDFSQLPAWVAAGLATPSGFEDFDQGPNLSGTTGLVKVDLHPTRKQTLQATVNSTEDDATGEIPAGIVAGSLVLPSGARTQDQKSLSLGLRHSWVGSNRFFLESNFKSLDGETGNNLDRDDRGETVLLLLLSGFLQTGAPVGGAQRRDVERLQATQSLTFLTGSGEHELKAGYDFVATDLTGFNSVWNDVEYSALFLAPNAADIMRDLFERLGFEQSAARFFQLPTTGGTFELDLSNDDVGLFVQDKWAARDELTVDLGLRWDRASLFGDDDDNIAPRFGLAWDIGNRQRTILKASAGLFYDQNALLAAAGVAEKGGIFVRNAFDVALPRLGFEYTDSLIDLVITTGAFGGEAATPFYRPLADALRANPFHLYELLGIAVDDPLRPPVVTADNVEALSGMSPGQVIALLESTYPGTDWEFFDVPGGSIVGNRVLSFFPRGALATSRDVSIYSRDKTPKTEAFTVGIEQRLGLSLVLRAHYVHRRTRDLLTRRITNLYDVPPGDPKFSQTTDGGPRRNTVTYDGLINYDGVTVSLERAFSGHYGFSISYTYSDAEDNLLTGNVGSIFSNNNHPEIDLGPSNLSAPNVGVASATARLPYDFRLSGILYWRDGSAFSPRGITDTDGDGLVDQRDTSVPRNSLRVADYVSLDLRLEKSLTVADHEITLLVDAFNVTNEKNVANVNAVSGPSFGIPNDFFPGREIQIGARYFFGGR